MSSSLFCLRQVYFVRPAENVINNLDTWTLFKNDARERIGKQFLSILISKSMIKTRHYDSNRNISVALKNFEGELTSKLKLNHKKDLYSIFGQYAIEHLELIQDLMAIEIELALIFFKKLQLLSENSQPVFNLRPFTGSKFLSSTTYESGSESTCQAGYSKASGDTKSLKQKWLQTIQEYQSLKSTKSEPIKSVQKTPNPSTTDELIDSQQQFIKQYSNHKQSQKKEKTTQQNEQSQDQDSFHYDETDKDKAQNKRDPCEQFFINLVAYLKNLSSPQAELTFIWQHLKWGDFKTFYDKQLTEDNEWVCSAQIHFPKQMSQSGYTYMQRTQSSKNKKKARNLACMDLLKSLYLQFPQVWFRFKHIKEQKKLVIPPLQEAKDDDELMIISNRTNYFVNKQKIIKLFKHDFRDIRRLMEGISAKAEMNTLLQQLPGRVASPKLEKKMVDGRWSVPVRIEYRTVDNIENGVGPKVYEKTVIFHNAKIAQEQAYMQALIALFQENPELFIKIQSIKIAKKIKDAQKKLPLIRNIHMQSEAEIKAYNPNKMIRLI